MNKTKQVFRTTTAQRGYRLPDLPRSSPSGYIRRVIVLYCVSLVVCVRVSVTYCSLLLLQAQFFEQFEVSFSVSDW